jgi:methylmalonyl-CoA/ethylmalonyl-CoA epimerase
MILRIDHIAIAVRDCRKAQSFFSSIFDLVPGASSEVHEKKYVWQLMSLGDLSRLELLCPTGEGSFLDGFLKNREGGVHHITLQTDDIVKARQRLDDLGIPYFGVNEYSDNYWKELFIHPRDAFGVLIQIAEFTAADWLSPDVNLQSGHKWRLEQNGECADLTLAHPGGGTVTVGLDRQEIRRLIDDLQTML